MKKPKIPYLQKRSRSRPDGSVWKAWYWVPSQRLRREGHEPIALGSDEEAARRLAQRQNDDVEKMRALGSGPNPTTVAGLIRSYCRDEEFTELAEASRKGYGKCLDRIERWAGDKPIGAITPKAVKAFKRSMQDRPRMANFVLSVLRVLYSYAWREGLVTSNPASRFRRYAEQPRDQVWTYEEEASFFEACAAANRPGLAVAFAIALYAGQRETDCLKLTRRDYDGTHLISTQSKTGITVKIPVVAPLKKRLDSLGSSKVDSIYLAARLDGQPYNQDHFISEVRKIMATIGVAGRLQFRDTRRTSVCRMFEAGLSVEEISGITGHQIDQTRKIIETYLPRSHRVTASTVQKLKTYYDARREG